MSFVNEDGVLTITDGAELVFDSSRDKLLHYLNPRIDGSIARPKADWSGSTTPSIRSYDAQIATLPAVSTDIVGLVRFRYSTGYTYLPPDAWFVAGGSFVLAQKDFQTISGVWGAYCSSMALATIYKSGNQLRYKEEISLKDHYMAGPNLNLAAFNVDYRIYPAAFS